MRCASALKLVVLCAVAEKGAFVRRRTGSWRCAITPTSAPSHRPKRCSRSWGRRTTRCATIHAALRMIAAARWAAARQRRTRTTRGSGDGATTRDPAAAAAGTGRLQKRAHKERQCMAHSPVHFFSALLLHLVTCVDRSRGYRYETSSSQNWMLPFARTERAPMLTLCGELAAFPHPSLGRAAISTRFATPTTF